MESLLDISKLVKMTEKIGRLSFLTLLCRYHIRSTASHSSFRWAGTISLPFCLLARYHMRWKINFEKGSSMNLNLLHKKSNTLRVADMKRMDLLRCNGYVHEACHQRFGQRNYGIVVLVIETILESKIWSLSYSTWFGISPATGQMHLR